MKFNINGLTYKIKKVEKDNEHLRYEDTYRFGVCNHAKQTIYLANNIAEQQMKRVLIHELTHAYINAIGMYVKEEYNVEELCEFVAYNSKKLNDMADRYFGSD